MFFGNKIDQPYGFTGRPIDKVTGLYNYRFRDYNPKVGRFIQPDPLGQIPGPNIYAYCNNNPINWVDPWGMEAGLGYGVEIEIPDFLGSRVYPIPSGKAAIGGRPLDLPSWVPNGFWPLVHTNIWYGDGTDSGFFNDDTISSDQDRGHTVDEYDFGLFVQYYEANVMRWAEERVQVDWDMDWRMGINIFDWNICQAYPEAVKEAYYEIMSELEMMGNFLRETYENSLKEKCEGAN